MEHGKIIVNIKEDYPGAEWYDVTITLPGYGGGIEGEFKLISKKRLLMSEDVIESDFFRPEYAKAIKKGLESV